MVGRPNTFWRVQRAGGLEKGQNLRVLGFLWLGDHGRFLGPGRLASSEAQLQTLNCLQRRSS